MALGERITETREFSIKPKQPFSWPLLAVLGIGLLFLFKPAPTKIVIKRNG